MATEIISGQKYNRWTAVCYSHNAATGNIFWQFICECGISKSVSAHRVISGHSKSCGCLRKEAPFNVTHGLRKHPLYPVWSAMKRRCYNKKSENYHDYGGRGIIVCPEWKDSFLSFYNDMADGYIKGEVELDREDVNGDYKKSNCRWATMIQGANNKRTSKYLSHNGIVRTISEWGRYLGVRDNTIGNRMRKGWADYECLFGNKTG
jgi:hypothetical protein